MKVNDNGVMRDMTEAEVAEFEASQREIERMEAEREPTEAERLRADLDFVMAMEGWI